MNEVMKGYIDDFVGVYLDEILVYTDGDEKDHERDLRKVFDCLWKHKLHAKLKKCDLGKDRVKYLGHVVGSGELRVDDDKIIAGPDWKAHLTSKRCNNSLVLLLQQVHPKLCHCCTPNEQFAVWEVSFCVGS